jgi:hypothetical protein
MPWPEIFLKQFTLVPTGTADESEYYGPFNSLLSFLFPVDEDFQVSPQYKGPAHPGSIDFTAIYIVNLNKHPVFFVEIKPRGQLEDIATRGAADDQMRDISRRLIGGLAIPRLFGISAMGSILCMSTTRIQQSSLPLPFRRTSRGSTTLLLLPGGFTIYPILTVRTE